MNKLQTLRPLVVAAALAAACSFLTFIASAAVVGPGETSRAFGIGPLSLYEIRHTIEGGVSQVSVRPGIGLLVLWLAFLGYGGARVLMVNRRGATR